MDVHILNVGQGNMVVVVLPDSFTLVYDCHITNDNSAAVLAYLASVLPKPSIDVFVNSHRDADHMRGVKKLHALFPIDTIWDSGVSANTGTPEYEEYMDLRRRLTTHEVGSGQYSVRYPFIRVLNGKRVGLNDANSQSIVLHIDYEGASILLAGDTDVDAWSSYIVQEYPDSLDCMVLYASHHGSFTFFNDPSGQYKDYTHHLEKMRPAITVISVGETNPHGHPNPEALRYYEAFSHGTTDSGQKIFRTDRHGNMRIQFNPGGTGTIYWDQH